MGIIKEQLDVDFVVDSRPLTKEEELAIRDFIKADKVARLSKRKTQKKSTKKQNKVN